MIGSQNNVATYSQMIDSGSSLLSLPCNTVQSSARNCRPNPAMYTLGEENLLSRSMCMANTTGCFYPVKGPPDDPTTLGSCAFASALVRNQTSNGVPDMHEHCILSTQQFCQKHKYCYIFLQDRLASWHLSDPTIRYQIEVVTYIHLYMDVGVAPLT